MLTVYVCNTKREVIISLFAMMLLAVFFVLFTTNSTQAAADRTVTQSGTYKHGFRSNFNPFRDKDKYNITNNSSVGVNHNISVNTNPNSACLGDVLDFLYNPELTYTASGGSWDTPYGTWCDNTEEGCDIDMRLPNRDNYQEIKVTVSEDRGRKWYAWIHWTAKKPSVSIVSSDTSVVACTGMQCTVEGDGHVNLEAVIDQTDAIIWSMLEKMDKGIGPTSSDTLFKLKRCINDSNHNCYFSPSHDRLSMMLDPVKYSSPYGHYFTFPSPDSPTWDITIDDCTASVCGNATIESPEQCDDGNTLNGDGCSATCQNEVASVCGNATIESPEQCDDGNTLNGDGCSATCQKELPVCGNGTQEPPEQCDDGNVTNGDSCSSTCMIETPSSICGNATQELGEQCDDGNTLNGDGCSELCVKERPPCTDIKCGAKCIDVIANDDLVFYTETGPGGDAQIDIVLSDSCSDEITCTYDKIIQQAVITSGTSTTITLPKDELQTWVDDNPDDATISGVVECHITTDVTNNDTDPAAIKFFCSNATCDGDRCNVATKITTDPSQCQRQCVLHAECSKSTGVIKEVRP